VTIYNRIELSKLDTTSPYSIKLQNALVYADRNIEKIDWYKVNADNEIETLSNHNIIVDNQSDHVIKSLISKRKIKRLSPVALHGVYV